MSCHNIQHLLSAYIDGELRGDESISIKAHTDGCSSCAIKIRHLHSISQITSCLPEVNPPNALLDQILAKTTAKRTVADKLIDALTLGRTPRLTGAASMVVIIAAAIYIFRPAAPVGLTHVEATVRTTASATQTERQSSRVTASAPNKQTSVQRGQIASNLSASTRTGISHARSLHRYHSGGRAEIASIKVANPLKKTAYKASLTADAKHAVKTADQHKIDVEDLATRTVAPDTSAASKDDTLQVATAAESKPAESKPAESKPAESKPAESKPAESKPAESAIITAKALSPERDIRLSQESDALKEMHEKLRARNSSRTYSSHYIQDANDRTVTVQIASMRF